MCRWPTHCVISTCMHEWHPLSCRCVSMNQLWGQLFSILRYVPYRHFTKKPQLMLSCNLQSMACSFTCSHLSCSGWCPPWNRMQALRLYFDLTRINGLHLNSEFLNNANIWPCSVMAKKRIQALGLSHHKKGKVKKGTNGGNTILWWSL